MPTTVLIIEPDKSTLLLIKNILSKSYSKIICTSSLQKGLKSLLSQATIDVILCSIELSKTDEAKSLQPLLTHNKNMHIPILFVATKANKKEIETATLLGADGFIFKPINPQVLTEVIKQVTAKYNGLVLKHRDRSEEGLADWTKGNFRYRENDFIFRFVNNKPTFVKVYSIKYFVARGAYLHVFLFDNNVYKTRRSISELESKLPKDIFVRIHRSIIINVNYIERVERWFNNTYRVFLKDIEKPFEMSRRYASLLKKL
jgi:DNA-binding LytR/AlgR family response regulator